MKRAAALVGMLVGLACLLFFFQRLSAQWSEVSQITFSRRLAAHLALALCLYLTTYLAAVGSWLACLRVLGVRIRYQTGLIIILVSQFAKYLPGNVGHHVGRLYMGKTRGIPMNITIGSMLLDTFLVLLAGLICSLSATRLLRHFVERYSAGPAWLLVLVAATSIGGLVILAAALARNRLAPYAQQALTYTIDRGNHARLLSALGLHCSNFLLGSFALWAICAGIQPSGQADTLIPMIGIYAASWIAGFVIPGAPAGLGIREAVMVAGLSAVTPPQVAVLATALMRAATIVGDGFAFAIGMMMGRPPFLSDGEVPR